MVVFKFDCRRVPWLDRFRREFDFGASAVAICAKYFQCICSYIFKLEFCFVELPLRNKKYMLL